MTERTVMEERLSPISRKVSPLTKFIRALYMKTPEDRMQADPVKAAEGYDLPVEWTTWWIEQARTCSDQWPIKTK